MPPQPTLWKRIAFAFVAGPVKVLIVAMCITLLLSILYTPCRSRESARRASCQSNLKQIALASLHYLKDNNTYPPAQNPPSPQGGKIYPSPLSTARAFQCPSDENATDTSKNSYGYNANLSGRKIVTGKSSISTIMSFEVKASADNKTKTGKTLAAVTAQGRHLDGANYAFADGHVKWLMPDRVSGTKPSGENFTFAVK